MLEGKFCDDSGEIYTTELIALSAQTILQSYFNAKVEINPTDKSCINMKLTNGQVFKLEIYIDQ